MTAKKPFSLEDALSFSPLSAWKEGATDPDISRDGQQIVFVQQERLWLVDALGGDPTPLTEGVAPQWSPVGDKIAFLRVGADTKKQIWIWDLASGQERQITQHASGITCIAGRLTNFCWHPEGHHLFFTSLVGRSRDQPANLPPCPGLFTVDVAAAETTEIATGAPGVRWSSPSCSPKGERVALRENNFLASCGEQQMHPAVVELKTGKVSYPVGHSKRQGFPGEWSPEGALLAFPYSPYDFVTTHRMVCTVVSTEAQDICPFYFALEYFLKPFRHLIWHPDGTSLFLCGVRGITCSLLQVNILTGDMRLVADAEGGVYEGLRRSADGHRLVSTHRTLTTLPEVYCLFDDGQGHWERRRLTNTSKRLEHFQLAETRVVQWQAPDGFVLEGVLTLPPGYRKGLSGPVIVDLHGGPMAVLLAEFYPEWHWLAAQGYIVFAPDFRGSQVYGWQAPPLEPNDALDVLAGVEWMLNEGCGNPDLLALRGHSYGAALGAYLLGHSHKTFFRAAVLDGMVSHYEDTLTTSPSPATPTLLLQGERDNIDEVRLHETWLRQAGVTTELAVYPQDEHTISSPRNRRDFWKRTLSWFDTYVRA